MKKIGLLVAFLGLVSGAMYATGTNFTTLKNKFVKPVKSQLNKSKTGMDGTIPDHNKSSISQSYTYATSEREY